MPINSCPEMGGQLNRKHGMAQSPKASGQAPVNTNPRVSLAGKLCLPHPVASSRCQFIIHIDQRYPVTQPGRNCKLLKQLLEGL